MLSFDDILPRIKAYYMGDEKRTMITTTKFSFDRYYDAFTNIRVENTKNIGKLRLVSHNYTLFEDVVTDEDFQRAYPSILWTGIFWEHISIIAEKKNIHRPCSFDVVHNGIFFTNRKIMEKLSGLVYFPGIIYGESSLAEYHNSTGLARKKYHSQESQLCISCSRTGNGKIFIV